MHKSASSVSQSICTRTGPGTNGTIVGKELIMHAQKAVNIQANVDRWSLSGIVLDELFPASGWLAIDTSSVAAVSYDAAGSATRQINSHLAFTGALPKLSDCGVGASIDAGPTDVKGVIKVGSGNVIRCMVSFAVPYGSAPVPALTTSDPRVAAAVASVGTNGFTASFSTSLGGGRLYYQVLQ